MLPAVRVSAPVTVNASDRENAPPGLLTVNAAIVLPLVVTAADPVSRIDAVNAVYVPVDDKFKLLVIFIVVAGNVKEVVPKSRLLNHPAVVNVATEAPVVNVRLGGIGPFDVLPTLNVLVLLISLTVNPPEPVYVNPPKAAIFNTTAAGVVEVRLTYPKKGA
jgi:hypothetical protein